MALLYTRRLYPLAWPDGADTVAKTGSHIKEKAINHCQQMLSSCLVFMLTRDASDFSQKKNFHTSYTRRSAWRSAVVNQYRSHQTIPIAARYVHYTHCYIFVLYKLGSSSNLQPISWDSHRMAIRTCTTFSKRLKVYFKFCYCRRLYHTLALRWCHLVSYFGDSKMQFKY